MINLLQAGMGLGIFLVEMSKEVLLAGLPLLVLIFYFLSLRKNKTQRRSSREVVKLILTSLTKAIVALIFIFLILGCLALILFRNVTIS